SFCFIAAIICFSCSALIGFLLAQSVPFNGQELFWDNRQILAMGLLSFLLLVPFFFGGVAIGLSLMVYRNSTAAIYGADLVGAGVGSLLVLLLLFLFFPGDLLVGIFILGLFCAGVGLFELRVAGLWIKLIGLATLALVLGSFGLDQDLKPSPYKSLQQHLRIKGTEVVLKRSSPLGLVEVLKSSIIPLRHAPGMSLVSGHEPPEQLGVFVNGEGLSPIVRAGGDGGGLNYLDLMTSALPYHLRQLDDVAVLGIGGGADILQARSHGAERITGVELNRQVVELLQTTYRDFTGNLLGEDVSIHVVDIRGFVEQGDQSFDLIHLSLVDSFLPSAAGLNGLQVTYLYTVEALQAYLHSLNPEGYLSITRWLKVPPRDGLKLMATAVEALRRSNIGEVARHLVLIRGWQTVTLLVKRSPFSRVEIDRIETFCKDRSFDIGYTHLTGEDQVNRFNLLQEPFFYQAARAITGENGESFLQQYKYNLIPATDDRPYFYHFFRWKLFGEMLKLRSRGGAALVESGYLILLTVFAVAVVLSFVLILIPLLVFKSRALFSRGEIARRKVLLYFSLIGIAFLFIEIAFIQKFILYLHHPVYAVSICVAAFLVFGGCGSLLSRPLSDALGAEKLLQITVCIIAIVSLCYLYFIGNLFSFTAFLPFGARILIGGILICPLALCMGMPFPLALSSLNLHARHMIPWAWAINGCSSVISTMGATLLAIHFGYSLVVLAAVTLYALTVFVFPVPRRDGSKS
ncbi:MAG: SAM-dependent methyltransferase, partial [Desulforhopalus sp.]